MPANQQPAPTYAPVVLYDEHAKDAKELLKSAKFNPIWLKWFLELVAQVSTTGGVFVPYTGAVGNVNLGAYDLSANNVTAAALLQALRIAITGTAGAGYMDFPAQSANPAAPAAGVSRFHSATTQGFTRFEQDNEAPTNLVLGRDNVFIAKNTTGSSMPPMTAVYRSGSTGNVPNIGLAKADSTSTLPAIGLTLDTIAPNAFGQVMQLGIMQNVNTNAFAATDDLWVSSTSAGGLTATRPVFPAYAQRVAEVLVKGVGNGSLQVVTAPFVGGQESGTDATSFTAAGTIAGSNLSGTNTGDQTITLSGAVSGTGTGAITTTLATPGTVSVTSTNDATSPHTHAVSSSSAPGAAAALLNTDTNGRLVLASTLGIGGATASTSGSGVSFPATQAASTDANTLDDYEEGPWTPVPTPAAGAFNTVGTVSGTYTKVGRLVVLEWEITITDIGTGTGVMNVSGFGTTPGTPIAARFSGAGNNASANLGLVVALAGSATSFAVYKYDGTAPYVNGQLMVGTIAYFV